MRPKPDFALCPGQLVTRDDPGVQPERCPRRTSCRRFMQPAALPSVEGRSPRQSYLLPVELGEACDNFVSLVVLPGTDASAGALA